MPRPLTQDEIEILKTKGEYREGMVAYEPGEYEQLTATAAPETKAPSSALGAFGRSAGRSVVPGIAGGLGVLGGTALAPATGGLSLALPIGGSIIGSILGNYAQRKALGAVSPETLKKFEESEQQDLSEHPIASLGGSITGGSLAGGVRPSIANIKEAGRGIANMGARGVKFKNLPPQQSGNIANVVGGAALNTGIEGGAQLARGEFDPMALAAAPVAGAVFNQPTALGKLYGFHPTSPEAAPQPQPDQVITPEGQVITPTEAEVRGKQRAALAKINTLNQTLASIVQQGGRIETPVTDSRTSSSQIDSMLGVRPPTERPQSFLTAEQAAVAPTFPDAATLRADKTRAPKGVKVSPRDDASTGQPPTLEQRVDAARPELVRSAQKIMEREAQRRATEVEATRVMQENVAREKARQEALAAQPKVEAPAPTPEPSPLPITEPTAPKPAKKYDSGEDYEYGDKIIKAGTTEQEARQHLAEFTKNDPERNYILKQMGPKDWTIIGKNKPKHQPAEEQPQPFTYKGYQEGFGTVPGQHVYNLTETIGTHPKGSTVTLNTLKSLGYDVEPPAAQNQTPVSGQRLQPGDISRASIEASRRGVTLGRAELPLSMPDGRRAAGVANRNRTSAVDPAVATRDTPLHEVLHPFLEDLRTSTNPHDRKIVETGERLLGGNEPLTQQAGTEYLKLIEREASKPGLRQRARELWNDFTATRAFDKGESTPEQTGRVVANQSRYRRSFGDDPALAKQATPARGVIGNSDGDNEQQYQPTSEETAAALQAEHPKHRVFIAKNGSVIRQAPQKFGVGKQNKRGFATSHETKYVTQQIIEPSHFESEYVRNLVTKHPSKPKGSEQYQEAELPEKLKPGTKDEEIYKEFFRKQGEIAVHAGDKKVSYHEPEVISHQSAALPEREVYGKPSNPDDAPDSVIESAEPEVITDKDKFALHVPNKLQQIASSAVDKVRFIGGKDAPMAVRKVANYAADSLGEMFRLETRYNGKYRENFARAVESTKLTEEESIKLGTYRWEMYNNGKSDLQGWYDSDSRIKKFNEALQNYLVEARLEQNAVGLSVSGRKGERRGGIHPFYDPAIVSQKVRRIVTDNQTTPEAQQLRKELEDFWLEKLLRKAERGDNAALKQKVTNDVDDYIQALGKFDQGNERTFAALRKAEGYGLPRSWVDPSVVNRGLRYFARYAKDMAYFRAIENNSAARSIFNIPDQFGSKELNAAALADGTPIDKTTNAVASNKFAAKAFESSLRYQSDIESIVFSGSRLVTSGWLGPWSGARDILSSFIHNLPYTKTTDLARSFTPALRDFRKYYNDSFASGVNRSKVNAIEFGTESVNQLADWMNTKSDQISQIQGRNLMEKVTRGVQFGMGVNVARLVFARGNFVESANFLRMFGKGLNNPKQYIGKTNIPDHVLNELAAQWVEHNQGTYDARGLPSGAVKGQFAGLLSLARWGIEKQNAMYKDVWLPAKLNRDITPLLKVTLGAVLGGEAIRQLGQVINNRLDFVPDWNELTKADKAGAEDIMANVITAVNMSGYFGITSQMAYDMLRIGTGRPPQGFVTLPALDYTSETLIHNTTDFINALHNKEPLDKAFLKYVHTMLKDTVQSYRIAANHTVDSGDQARKKDLRNLAVFRDLDGKSVDYKTFQPQQITGLSARNFDRAENLTDARQNLPGAVDVAIARSNGEPETLNRNLKTIARQQDPRLPNPETPEGRRELTRYKNFIIRTQGEAAWNKLLNSYVEKKKLDGQKKALFREFIAQNKGEIKRKYEAVGMR